MAFFPTVETVILAEVPPRIDEMRELSRLRQEAALAVLPSSPAPPAPSMPPDMARWTHTAGLTTEPYRNAGLCRPGYSGAEDQRVGSRSAWPGAGTGTAPTPGTWTGPSWPSGTSTRETGSALLPGGGFFFNAPNLVVWLY